jgi:hypothetical protein
MERAIQQVFQHHFSEYAANHRLSLREHQAAQRFIDCRTAKLGGHIERCPEGHFQRAHYNSCKHRSCAQCNALQTERWLERQKARLLDCPHHHLIFTVAHELIPLWLFNRSTFMNLLFQAVDDTLKAFLRDPRHLGACPGALLAFHSWGRDLSIHPHIHCLITDGGLTQDGQWQRPRRSHFLPAKPLMLAFRGRFCALVHRGLDQGTLLAPGGATLDWHRRIAACQSKKWNVRLERRYDHARGVAVYLARYVRGGPVRNSQVVTTSKGIRLDYYDHRLNANRKKKQCSTAHFTREEFFRRYLQHVPEKRRQVVRAYGLYAARARDRLNLARGLHDQQPVADPVYLEWETFMERHTGDSYRLCPLCQRRLQCGVLEVRQQGPPQGM